MLSTEARALSWRGVALAWAMLLVLAPSLARSQTVTYDSLTRLKDGSYTAVMHVHSLNMTLTEHAVAGASLGPAVAVNSVSTYANTFSFTFHFPALAGSPGNLVELDFGINVWNGAEFAGGGLWRFLNVRLPDVASPPLPGSWSTAAAMPTARADMPAVTGPDGRIYVINGRTGNGVAPYLLLEIYDPATDTWTTGPAPLDGHYGGQAVLGHDGKIYLMGGYYRDPFVEVFDPLNPQLGWTALHPMPTGRFAFEAATGRDGRIYTFGGDTSGGGETVTTVEVYDPLSNTWSSRRPMPLGRSRGGTAVGPDGRIYLIGGYNSANVSPNVGEVSVYTPDVDSWAVAAPMPTPRRALGVVLGLDGRAYAIGGELAGFNPNPEVNTVEAYNVYTDSWQTLAPMPTARAGFGTALSPDGRIFAIGGVTNSAFGVTTNEAFLPTSSVQDVSSRVTVRRGGFVRNRANGRFYQQVSVTNTGTSAITGPVSLVLDNLSSNATMFDKSGVTSATSPAGSPYVDISPGTLGVGQTATITLDFADPTNDEINYTTRVLAGPGSR